MTHCRPTLRDDIETIKHVADARFNKGHQDDLRVIASRLTMLEVWLAVLAEKWDGEASRVSFASAFAAELRNAVGGYVDMEEAQE